MILTVGASLSVYEEDVEEAARSLGANAAQTFWHITLPLIRPGIIAGAVFAFSKGSISPSAVSISQSTDGLVMVLLGGVETLTGPVVGAAIFTWLRDTLARETDFWRGMLGLVILLIVVAFPQGLVGGLKTLVARWRPA